VRLCCNKQLRTDLVDEAVWEEVCRLLEHPERLEQEYRRRLLQQEQAQHAKDEASLERELTLILGRLDEFAARVKTGLHEADWLTRRQIIRALVKRVAIDKQQVRVVFRVNPPPQASQPPSEKDSQSLQHCRRCGQPDTGRRLSA
jgi:site-specific DNA recombinase